MQTIADYRLHGVLRNHSASVTLANGKLYGRIDIVFFPQISMPNPFEQMGADAAVMPGAPEQTDVKNALKKLQDELNQDGQNIVPEMM